MAIIRNKNHMLSIPGLMIQVTGLRGLKTIKRARIKMPARLKEP
jgi:hypothetical protein